MKNRSRNETSYDNIDGDMQMNAEATDSTRMLPICTQDAQKLPNGARFYRCALHVNPYAHLVSNNKKTSFSTEEEYNKAIVNACRESNIEVIAVTDHYCVEHSKSLVQAARDAGLIVFSGFEAVTKDGIHFLCLFDKNKEKYLERYIGECGIRDQAEPSPTGNMDASGLLVLAKNWGAICIAAHVAGDGGLLKKLSGQSRVKVWKHPDLLACALPGPIKDAPEGIRPILENKDAQHQRDRMPAIVNASDVCNPEDLNKPKASCFIKMSSVSVEGFRQAFLDPDSRIRLHSDPIPEPHAEFISMEWQGGFLGDMAVRFNENLNVLVGGRGAGKSTFIESIRYVLGLDPLGVEAKKTHDGMVRYVLRSGTKILLHVRSHKPSKRCYVIERSVPNPPVVRDEEGELLTLSPRDVMPGVEVFGQHEISELTKNPEKLTRLLERFVDRASSPSSRKSEVHADLERSRRRIIDVRREMKRLDERLAALPGLEETQKRFQQAGLEERLKEKGLAVREEQIFANLRERLQRYHVLHSELAEELPVDTAFISSKALQGLPNADILAYIEQTLTTLSGNLKTVSDHFGKALDEAERAIEETKSRWDTRKIAIDETYENLLRTLQKEHIDGAEFIQIRKQIEELRPLRDKMEKLGRDLKSHEAQRRSLLVEWEDIKSDEYRQIEIAAKRVSRKLRGKVWVSVVMAGSQDLLEYFLRNEVGGKLAPAFERLRQRDQLSLFEFARHCREGKKSLMKQYGLPSGAAERIADADPDQIMRIEELELPTTTEIALNTAHVGEPEKWQTLQTLSTGQKATAVLLLLLLESEAPLVIDQPEDDLDNRFITEDVIPIIREEKRRRQFIFSTHNANIPVLGDAELIIGLDAEGEAGEGHASISPKHMCSIDSQPVRELVEEILEGGKAAFETRRAKYGF